jgi:hypothetical protein
MIIGGFSIKSGRCLLTTYFGSRRSKRLLFENSKLDLLNLILSGVLMISICMNMWLVLIILLKVVVNILSSDNPSPYLLQSEKIHRVKKMMWLILINSKL